MLEVKDFRKYNAEKEAQKIQEEAKAPLLPQVSSDAATTGDIRLDKFARSMAAMKAAVEAEQLAVMKKGIECVQEDAFRFCQFQYYYAQGRIHQLNDLEALPAKIIAEEKLS